jgi:predicted amidohydrolase
VDGNGLAYAGDSVVLDALGQPIIELGAQAQVVSTQLDAAALMAHRQRFPAQLDADRFSLIEDSPEPA